MNSAPQALNASHAASPADNPRQKYFWIILAAGLSALTFAIGLFIFASNAANRELYHGWYLLAFFVTTCGMAASIGTRRFGTGVFLMIVIMGILSISIMKFNWRAKLMERVSAANPVTILGDYVRDLPTLEEYWYPYSHKPNWVKFDEECFIPLSKGEAPAPECGSKDTITATYRVNVLSVISERFQLMKQTAQRINTKELSSRDAYVACVNDLSCAAVPLLPADANIAEVTDESDLYQKERIAFWQLIDKPEMTSALCDYMSLCKAMVKSGAVVRTDFTS